MQFEKVRRIVWVAMAIALIDSRFAKVFAQEPKTYVMQLSDGDKAVDGEQDYKIRHASDGRRIVTKFNRVLGSRVVFSASVSQSDSRIGIDAVPVDEILRSHLGLAEGKGVIVSKVVEGSPAAKAGLQKNDVLTAVADAEITGIEGLERLLEAQAEKATTINLIRSGKPQSVEITPAPKSKMPEIAARIDATVKPIYWLGLGLAAADDALRSQLAIAAGEGLVVTQVEEAGPAKKAGVMVNDLLLKLDGKPLASVETVVAQIQEIAHKSVSLELLRNGKSAMLTVTPEKREQPVTPFVAGQPFPADHLIFLEPSYNVHLREYIKLVEAANPGQVDSEELQNRRKQISDLVLQVQQVQIQLERLAEELKVQTTKPTTASEKK